MKQIKLRPILLLVLLLIALIWSCQNSTVQVEQMNNTTIKLNISGNSRYLIVPIEEEAQPMTLYIPDGKNKIPFATIRLAKTKADYEVPVLLPKNLSSFCVEDTAREAYYRNNLSLSDEFSQSVETELRPSVHVFPQQGWMGRAAGAIYANGQYHYYYECNPHGSLAENIHWGHAVSSDLVNWTVEDVAFGPDSIGQALGGSVVMDKHNKFGAGTNSLIAIYSASRGQGTEQRQEQCLAYTQNGNIFQKFATNPVLRTYDDIPDFRHPNVFRYTQGGIWQMVVACGHKLRIYSSEDLGNWNLESYIDDAGQSELVTYEAGEHRKSIFPSKLYPSYESGQLIEIPSQGGEYKWVLLCNLRHEGKSYVKTFVGDFNGKKFIPQTQQQFVTDWGNDYSGAIAIQEIPNNRCILLGALGNDVYSDRLPTIPYRGQMALPRELTLQNHNGVWEVAMNPIEEMKQLRGECETDKSFPVNGEREFVNITSCNSNAYELEMDYTGDGLILEFYNSKNEKVVLKEDVNDMRWVLDRSQGGWLVPDGLERVSAPLVKTSADHHLRIFVDRTSIEAFIDGGKVVLSDLIYPTEPLISLRIKGQELNIKQLDRYPLHSKPSK